MDSRLRGNDKIGRIRSGMTDEIIILVGGGFCRSFPVVEEAPED